ncbi:hypothetical protein RMCBS344292_16435 [Rhizopus microsporus]|nr:hypothetical protein RMCBS344292_16435 [Rhizopus microsporus]
MKNTLNIRLQHLQQYHPDTFKAYNWLKEHRQEFKGRVYNPILLELNLKDSRYASHIERILGGFRSNMLRTIVFENEEDYIKFTRFAADEQKWRITAALPEELSDDLLNKPTTTEELREKFKFEHYMVDLVQAPKYLLKYICLETKMNMIPVSLKPTDERHIANSGIFQKFTAAQSYYNVRPNRYRHGTYQTEVNHLPPARVLNDSVDNEERRNLIESIRTHQANMQQCEQDLKELSKKKDTIDQAIRELEFKKSDLQSQKRDIHIAAQQYEARKRRLRQLVEERDQLKNEPEEDRVKMDRYKEMIQELIEEEAEHLSNYTNIAEKMVEAYRACSRRKLESIVATAKYDALKSYIRNQASALEEAQKTLSSYKREHDMLANRVKTLMGAVRTAGKELSDGLREEFTAVVRHWKENGPTYTVEELGLKIREKEGEASAIRYANPDAMRHFEERMSKINQLQRTIDVRKRDLEEINAKITELREQWEPRIDSLIKRISDKFSEAFQRIGCAGEVGIDKQEDFDKWGAQIRVKFRNTEKLQVLTGQRQSGGERSVSTILYLMSLQSLAKTPFRVVDEINQGMDPRNERLIHQQIVEGASRSGTSQYFLITPKLLPDLYYNEQMRVLCIYNGEWVPNKISPLEKYLAHARAHPEVV